MSNLTTRAGKGSPLTNNELDANFTNLNADKVEIGGDLSGTSSAPNVAKIQGRAVSADAPAIGEKLVWNGTAWEPSADPTNEPIGHEDKSSSSISFNSGTRTFTISPVAANFVVWCKGVKYTYTSAQAVVIPDTTGLHFIYFNASGVLSTQMSYFTWEEHAPTAYVYWNATTQQAVYFGDERHGITLDWQTHEYLHRTRGAAIASGFGASGYTTTGAGATDADAQIDIGGGTFFDEDLQVDIVSTNTPVAGAWQQDLSGPARIPVLYLNGSAWVIDAPTDFPFKVVSGVPQYNLYSGGTWSSAPVANNSYFVSWILATHNLTYPVIAVISQAATNQVSQAEAMTFEGLTLSGFPSVEFRPLYKVIYQHKTSFANNIKASTIAVYDLRSISAAGVAAALVQDHGNLSGLGDDDHAQYLHVSEVRSPSTAVKNSFLPSQASQSGKYLTTDGSNPSWGSIPSGSLTFTGDVTGTGTTGSSTTLTLSNSGASAGTYTKVTVDAKGRVTTGASINSSDVTTALGFTPENSGNKGVANGYASLDGAGKVPSTQLPSYVDDVLEYANLAAFPGTGETGKIYIAIDTAKTYRWSGSAYVEITASPGSTDAVPEGSTNLYFTNSRARGAITATGSLSYNNQTGVLSYTQPTNVSTFTNDSGYLTGITGTQVANALGYTPPQPNGTGASGTWGISISGNAATVSSITSGQVTTALGYTPYNATNPSGYITSSALSSYLPLSGGTLTGDLILSSNWGAGSYNEQLIIYGTYPSMTFRSTYSDSGWLVHTQGDGGLTYYSISGATTNNWSQRMTLLTNGELRKGGTAGNLYIHDGNYSSYALPLSGGTLTGSPTISGNGNGLYFTGGNNRIYFGGSYRAMEGNGNGTQLQIGEGYSATYLQSANNYATTSNHLILHAGNYSSYALPLSGGTLTGVVNSIDFRSQGQIRATGWYNNNSGTYTGLGTEIGVSGGGSYILSYNRDTGSYGTLEFNATNIRLVPISGGSVTGPSGNVILHAGNYTSYSPSLTGSGASGTWGISISGTAAELNSSRFNTTAGSYNNASTWIQFGSSGGYGLYFPGSGAMTHFYPNSPATYGSAFIEGSKNSYWGIMYNTGAGNAGWMTNGNTTGFYNHSYGWKYYHESGRFYSSDSTYGAGNTWSMGLHNTQNPVLYSSAGGAMGLLGVNSSGSYRWQIYGEGSTYGFLQSAWGAWDIQKTVNGQLLLRVSSTDYTALHSGNYSSYALPLSGGTMSGNIIFPNDSSTAIINASQGAGYRPDDIYGNTYMWNNAGGWYGDFTSYFWRNASSSNLLTLGSDQLNSLVPIRQSGNQVLHAANYSSYSPTLTGGGASGTWGINITGNAGSVSSISSGQVTSALGYTPYPNVTPNGYATGDIAGTTAHQRLWGTDSVQNMFAFNPPTEVEYSTNGSTWVATTCPSDVWDGKIYGKWGGMGMSVGNNIGGWRYVRMTWRNFGYRFFSHFTLAHSTNGHSFNFVFYKSDLNGNFGGEAFRMNSIGSWPGYTFVKHENVSGWWDTRDIRIVFELNHNNDYPNNAIGVGHIGLMGSYGGFTRLYDWNADRSMYFKNAFITDSSHQVLHAGNYSSYALPLSGGSLTGNLYINGSIALNYSNFSNYALPLAGGTITGDVAIGYGFNGFNNISGTEKTLYIADSNVASLYLHAVGGSGRKYILYSTASGSLSIYDANAATVRFALSTSSANFSVALQQSGNQVLHAGNYTSYAVPQSDVSTSGGGSKVLKTEANGYLYLYNWINTGGGGLFSSTNSSHFYPNSGSYGSWRIAGSRNGWSGIEFDATHQVSLMINNNANDSGFHNNSYGWQLHWANGVGYIGKNAYGGNEAVILDSSNYSSYALPLGGGTVTGTANFSASTYPVFVYGNSDTSGAVSKGLQVYSTGGNGAVMAFHRGGYYAVNFGLDSDNVIRIGGWSAGTNRLQMDMSGNLTMAGNVTAYSDERLKKDWSPIAAGFVDRLAGILAGTYTRIDSEERQAGVSAQKMREILPEVVSEDNEGTLALAYGNAAMVSAVELAKELVTLKKELAEIKSRLH